MLHPSTKRLIDRLSEMTIERKIDWALDEQPDTIVFDTEGYKVVLEGQPASVVLRDALGQELERADTEALNATPHENGGTYETLLEVMRKEASRIARGTEAAIETVLQGLERASAGSVEVEAEPENTDIDESDITPSEENISADEDITSEPAIDAFAETIEATPDTAEIDVSEAETFNENTSDSEVTETEDEEPVPVEVTTNAATEETSEPDTEPSSISADTAAEDVSQDPADPIMANAEDMPEDEASAEIEQVERPEVETVAASEPPVTTETLSDNGVTDEGDIPPSEAEPTYVAAEDETTPIAETVITESDTSESETVDCLSLEAVEEETDTPPTDEASAEEAVGEELEASQTDLDEISSPLEEEAEDTPTLIEADSHSQIDQDETNAAQIATDGATAEDAMDLSAEETAEGPTIAEGIPDETIGTVETTTDISSLEAVEDEGVSTSEADSVVTTDPSFRSGAEGAVPADEDAPEELITSTETIDETETENTATPIPEPDTLSTAETLSIEAEAEQTEEMETTAAVDEDTPDVGKAVADLAKQVSENEADALSNTVPHSPNTLIGGPAMLGAGISNAESNVGVVTENTEVHPDLPEDASTEPAVTSTENNTVDPDMASAILGGTFIPDQLPAADNPVVPQPGETLSLSTLHPATEAPNDLIMASETEAKSFSEAKAEASQTLPDHTASSSTDTSSSDAIDNETATGEATAEDEKRFNPWL